MQRRRLILVIALGLCSLLLGCGGETTSEVLSDPSLEQVPLLLAQPFFNAGYELVDYYTLDVDDDGVVEALAVLTLKTQATHSFLGGSAVVLFGQREGSWVRVNNWKLNGVNASAELHDLTGDDLPELLVRSEEAHRRPGDFVTPLQYTDYLSVFTYAQNLRLTESGVFSSSLASMTPSKPTLEKWEGQPAIQTVQDLPPAASPLWQPVRVETFAWDGQEFARVRVEEQRRISPVVSWAVRRNAPWAAASLALGGVLSLIGIVVARRSRWPERRVIWGLILLLVAGGIGLSFAVEWICVPALIAIGWVGLGIGRQIATWLAVKPNQNAEVARGAKGGE